MKKRHIALDADYLIFETTEDKGSTGNYFEVETGLNGGSEYQKPLKPYKKILKKAIAEVVDEIAANLPGEVSGKVKVIFSDPNGNFRYDIFPNYKNNRKGSKRSKMFYRLRKWAHRKYGYEDGVEADDVVAYYVREKGWIGASFDKDLLKGVPGTWFDVYHLRRFITTTTKKEAAHFNLLQTLAGDSTDGIKGIPRVGMKTAENLLRSNGESWEGVVKSYLDAGLTEEDAILNRRLIGMDQWTKKKGLKLWKPKKDK